MMRYKMLSMCDIKIDTIQKSSLDWLYLKTIWQDNSMNKGKRQSQVNKNDKKIIQHELFLWIKKDGIQETHKKRSKSIRQCLKM